MLLSSMHVPKSERAEIRDASMKNHVEATNMSQCSQRDKTLSEGQYEQFKEATLEFECDDDEGRF